MTIQNFKSIPQSQWDLLCGEPEIRELNYHYLSLTDTIDQMPLSFILHDQVILPYYDGGLKNNDMQIIFNDLLAIFSSDISISSTDTVNLFFVPSTWSGMDFSTQLELIAKLKTMFPTKHLLFLYSTDLGEKKLSIEQNAVKTAICSYNTVLNIEWDNTGGYLKSLNADKRKRIAKIKRRFESSGLEMRMFPASEFKERMACLYKSVCEKYGERSEPEVFWHNVDSVDEDSLKWCGIFKGQNLIAFSGYWKSKTTAISSISGKDYAFENELNASQAYFMMFNEAINMAIKDNMRVLYNGYGLDEMKSQFGYKKVDYAVSYYANY